MRRLACPACHFVQVRHPKVVAVVVVHYQDKLLLAKRTMEPGKGLWNFCGGYVEFGETVQEAAVRAVKEEANLDVQLAHLIGVYSEGGGSHVVIAYQAHLFPQQLSALVAQRQEVSELALFAWEELPTLAFPVHQLILRDWKKLTSE